MSPEKEQGIEAGEEFHWEIAKRAVFKTVETQELLKILMKPTGPDYKDPTELLRQIIVERQAIIKAIKSRDEDKAEKAMQIHLAAQPVHMRAH